MTSLFLLSGAPSWHGFDDSANLNQSCSVHGRAQHLFLPSIARASTYIERLRDTNIIYWNEMLQVDRLPVELLIEIFSHLHVRDLLKCQKVRDHNSTPLC